MPRPCNPARIGRQLNKQLLGLMQNGRPAFYADGTPIMNEDGTQMHRPPTAADLQAARMRLKDLGYKSEQGDSARVMAAQIKQIHDSREQQPVASIQDVG